MDLKEIAEAYQLVYEKKADKDYDGDGKIESGTDEYMGSKDKAIKKAMGKKVKHDCSSKVKHEEYGIGDCIKEMHTLDAAGNITHYDVMFEHGIEKNVSVSDLSVLVSEMHEHVINTDKNKEVLGNKDLMSAYYSMYEHHKKDADGNTIPHEDEIEEEVISETPKGDKGKDRATKVKDRIARSYGGSGTYGAKFNAPARRVFHDMKRGVKKDKGHVDRPGKPTSDFIDDRSSYIHTSGQGLKGSTKHGTSDYDEPSRRKDMVIKFKTRKEEIDLSFVDQLTEQELDNLVEGVVYDLLDEGIELDAIEGAFTEYLDEAVELTEVSDKYYDSAVKTSKAAAKVIQKRERQKAQKEKVEKFKKAVKKAVKEIKPKMHGGMSKYASKRKLIPTDVAKKAAATPERVAPAEPKGKSKKAQREFEMQKKGVEMANKSRAEKMKGTKRTQDINRSLGKKESRKELRSVVFKDVKDRVGKKAKAVIDAPTKVGQGIRSLVGKGKRKIGRSLVGLGQKMQEQGGELDMFDTVTAYLIDEGLVRDFDHAQKVMTTLDSSLIEEVHAEQLEYLKEYGKATAESGTGKFYNEKKPTAMQLAKRETLNQVKDLTNKGKHQEASDKYKSLTDEYLKVYEKYDSSYSHAYATTKEKAPKMQKGAKTKKNK